MLKLCINLVILYLTHPGEYTLVDAISLALKKSNHARMIGIIIEL